MGENNINVTTTSLNCPAPGTRKINYDINEGFSGDDVTWNQEKAREYFEECMKIIDPFLDAADEMERSFIDFINDDEHTGPEADESKYFVQCRLYVTLVDTVNAAEALKSMMLGKGKGKGRTAPVLDDFNEMLDENDMAILSSAKLEKVIKDFAQYNGEFGEIAKDIEATYKRAKDIIKKSSVTKKVKLKKPDSKHLQCDFDEFVTSDETKGTVVTFYKKFESFIKKHEDDFSKSEFKTLIDRVLKNLKEIMGDPTEDPDIDDGKREEQEHEKKQEDVEKYRDHQKGVEPRSQSYNYDPVNMITGNFISSEADISVSGGRYFIEARRFYNALSDKVGVLGKGWNFNYEQHISLKGDDIVLFFEDGKECYFEKTTIAGEEAYVEVHGDDGVFHFVDNVYRLSYDDNRYYDFDTDGYLVAAGDNYGQHTTVDYEIFEKVVDGAEVRKALPSLVKTKEGCSLSFTYDEKGLLTKAKDHTGREVSYRYEDENDEYRLTSIVAVNGAERKYTYTENGLIQTSVRADGVVTLVNEYDDKNRVVKQTLADGSVYSFSYDEESHITTAVEPNGCRVEYVSDMMGRHIATRFPDLGVDEKFLYNDQNQKVSYTDRRGYTTRYSYDNYGHLMSIFGPEGLHEYITYDSEGKMTSKKDSDGNVTKYKYDLDGNLYSVANPLGDKIKFDYEAGRVVAIRDPENKKTYLTYDERGFIASITDPSGVVTKYECDELGRVVATENADGARTTFDVDANGNIIRSVDPEGNVTSYEYDLLGKLVSITNPDGTVRRWEYNEMGKPSAFTDEEFRTTKVYYNNMQKEEKIVLPNSGELTFEYDLLGNLVKTSDADGRVTEYSYDAEGNVLTVEKPDEAEECMVVVNEYEYDGLGRIAAEYDGNGNRTEYEYDGESRITKVTDADGHETLMEYDAAGRLIKETDAEGNVTAYTYDKAGNLKTTTEPSGVVTENTYEDGRLIKVCKKAAGEEILVSAYEYDSCGRIATETKADGFTATYSYTAAGNIKTISESTGRVISYTYDACGRVLTKEEGDKVTTYAYTGTGKIKSVVDAIGNRTEYTYDELDLLKKIERFAAGSEGDGRVTIYEHSLAGKLETVTDALGIKDVYEYDNCGKLFSHTDRDGYRTVYTRDLNGNVTGIDYADGSCVRLSYNALNVLEEVKDELGLTSIESDAIGRTTKVTDYKGRSIAYEYGPYDHETAVIYPDGKRVEYSFDEFGRMKSLNSDGEVSYSYDAAGRLSGKALPNGINVKFDYYQGGLLKSLVSSDAQGIIDEYSYKYNSANAITDIERKRRDCEEASGAYHYEYDNLGRLSKSSVNGELSASYEYDGFGNRSRMMEAGTETVYEYDALDRLTRSVVKSGVGSEVVSSYRYDRRGNQVALLSGDVVKKAFEFDAKGKMVKATDAAMGSTTYKYNGLGYRVESLSPEHAVEYVCDISRDYYNLLERTVNGQDEKFVYDTNVVGMNKGGENYYYLQDELGSTMYLTGTDGAVVNAYSYDDFGKKTIRRNGQVSQPFAFTGYEDDEVSGLSYAQARYYDPMSGRFNAEDRVRGFIDEPETINHYNYCFNNPISLVDVDGNFPSGGFNLSATSVLAPYKAANGSTMLVSNSAGGGTGATGSTGGLAGGLAGGAALAGRPIFGGSSAGGSGMSSAASGNSFKGSSDIVSGNAKRGLGHMFGSTSTGASRDRIPLMSGNGSGNSDIRSGLGRSRRGIDGLYSKTADGWRRNRGLAKDRTTALDERLKYLRSLPEDPSEKWGNKSGKGGSMAAGGAASTVPTTVAGQQAAGNAQNRYGYAGSC
ncbi:RHS repeat-associated core domain-containing protein [Butyrivibrio proteoclasticus]|uniref:RHS repeat-associated core domain-containing protein n=1 Tax=Butyrivibrio proteoclasticus TaxID=43305 RepID=UPI0004792B7F|nr:RHS repeat-associated core domain-containing protein [Butyrivibrio proteoclasticus]